MQLRTTKEATSGRHNDIFFLRSLSERLKGMANEGHGRVTLSLKPCNQRDEQRLCDWMQTISDFTR